MTALLVWRWLSTLPRIVYVIALAVALIVGGIWFTYHAGATHAVAKAHAHALADSIDKETIVTKIVQDQADSARAVARFAKRQADETKGRRALARTAVDSLIASLPEPVVTLIRLDDQLIRRDSVAITAYMAADTAALREREIATQLDELRQHQTAIGQPAPRSHRLLWVIVGAAGMAGAVLLHAAVR